MPKTGCQNLANITFADCLKSAYLVSWKSILFSPVLIPPSFGFTPFCTPFPSSVCDKVWYTCSSHQCPWIFFRFPKIPIFFPKNLHFYKTYKDQTTLVFKKNLPLPSFGFTRFFTPFPSADWDKIWYTYVFFSSMPIDIFLGFPKFHFFSEKLAFFKQLWTHTILHHPYIAIKICSRSIGPTSEFWYVAFLHTTTTYLV